MKKLILKRSLVLLVLLSALLYVSCLDEFLGKEDDSPSHPEWLNESVYDYLVKDGNYKYFLNLIDSAGYAEVLQKTGSKTLFVANDSTFEAFLNERGTTFENLSAYDRQAILFSNMLNNTYLLEMLSRQQGNPPAEGQVMRRITEWNPLMALQFTPPDSLPDNPYWARFREKGPALIAKDEHSYTMIHFLQTFLQSKGITDADFELITGRPRQPDDIFIFDARVKPNPALPQQYGDIACKNGYVNEVDKVLYPVDNLSEYIRKNPSTQIFNRLLDRFSFPIYASTMTQEYRRDVDPTYADSVFAKHYFSLVPEPRYAYDPSDSRRSVPALRFDPGANNYSSSGTRAIDIQTDMAAMFIPTDEAMQQYLSPQGAGSIIIDRYGTIEEIPDDIVKTLLDNHMWSSFINTVPSRFHTIAETNDVTLGITQADIAGARICSNGIAYMTNKVYSPSEFSSVIAPVTFNDNAAIVRKGIKDTSNPFDVYLNSMVNKFSFFVYTDSVMNNYINPASIAKDRLEPEGIRFADIPRDASQIRAVLYKPLVSTDSVRAITNAVAKAMLKDIIDNNIVIGTLEEGKEYYSTKGGATIRILPGTGLGAGMKVQGRPAMTLLTETEDAITATVTAKEEQKNGATFFLDKIVQPPLYSVYHILSDTVNNPQFSEFFYLCSGAMEVADPNSASLPKVSKPIFVNEIIFKSANLIVSFFNTFNYSVYVPTNQAVREYILREFPGLNATPETIWDEIRNMEDLHDQAAAAKKLYDFLLYHFQDNSVYIRGGSEPQFYETALLNPESKRFRRLYVVPEGENLKVYSEKEGEKHSLLANVITTTPDYYNIMARDCQFTSNNTIETSSFAVIHQIDNVLEYDK